MIKKFWDFVDKLLLKWDNWEDQDITIKLGPHIVETNNYTIQYFCLLIVIFIILFY